MSLTRAQAIQRVVTLTDAASYPEVTTTEIGQMLDDTARWSTWTAAASYAVGDRIVPVTPNGRVYEAYIAGTSGATEPSWIVYGSYEGWSVSDGTSDPALRWVDRGPAHVERYDVRTVAQRVWLVKASRVAGEVDTKDGSADVKLSQLHDRCVAQAARFRPVVLA